MIGYEIEEYKLETMNRLNLLRKKVLRIIVKKGFFHHCCWIPILLVEKIVNNRQKTHIFHKFKKNAKKRTFLSNRFEMHAYV